MTIGKITVESGEQKAIFNFNNEKCTMEFEPAIDLKEGQEKTDEQIFVENVTAALIEILTN